MEEDKRSSQTRKRKKVLVNLSLTLALFNDVKRKKDLSRAARAAIRELKRHENIKEEIEKIQNDDTAYELQDRKSRIKRNRYFK